MDLELHQLDRRYEALRTRSARRERRLLSSLSEVGQQTPIIVVRDSERWVVVDGYKRVRAVHRLGQDVVRATEWALSEAEALLLERTLRGGDADSAIEQGWLVRELMQRFGLGLDELSRRFDRSVSWVSRRLGLVTDLPPAVQEQVRLGAIGAHAAMKYLVGARQRERLRGTGSSAGRSAPDEPSSGGAVCGVHGRQRGGARAGGRAARIGAEGTR
jgi:ParB family chromosome partitioning protein